jgi:hypothetical protein
VTSTARTLWLVDAYNVLAVSLKAGAPLTGVEPRWWSADRRQLLVELTGHLCAEADEVCLVFDGRHLSEAEESSVAEVRMRALPADAAPSPVSAAAQAPAPAEAPTSSPRLRVLFAPSADEWIVAAVRDRADEFGRRLVVSADRRLCDRSRSRGAEIVSTQRFVELCTPRTPQLE